MTTRSPAALARIWLLLLALSLCGVLAVRLSAGSGAAIAVVLVLALFKCRFILLDFMGLRDAPVLLRRALFCWCVVVAGLALAKVLVLAAMAG